MNRRKFFGFLAAAPVAIPAAIVALKPSYASGGFVAKDSACTIIGERVPETCIPLSRLDRIPIRFTEWTADPRRRWLMTAEFRQ